MFSANWSYAPTVQILIIGGWSLADQSCIRVGHDSADMKCSETANRIWRWLFSFQKDTELHLYIWISPFTHNDNWKAWLAKTSNPKFCCPSYNALSYVEILDVVWCNHIDFRASLALSWCDWDGLLRLLSSCKFDTFHQPLRSQTVERKALDTHWVQVKLDVKEA